MKRKSNGSLELQPLGTLGVYHRSVAAHILHRLIQIGAIPVNANLKLVPNWIDVVVAILKEEGLGL